MGNCSLMCLTKFDRHTLPLVMSLLAAPNYKPAAADLMLFLIAAGQRHSSTGHQRKLAVQEDFQIWELDLLVLICGFCAQLCAESNLVFPCTHLACIPA